MLTISDKICPICKVLAGVDIHLSELAYLNEVKETTDSENAKQYSNYMPPDNLLFPSNDYVKLYQCPCCKTIYEEGTTGEKRTWEIRYKELIEEYKQQEGL